MTFNEPGGGKLRRLKMIWRRRSVKKSVEIERLAGQVEELRRAIEKLQITLEEMAQGRPLPARKPRPSEPVLRLTPAVLAQIRRTIGSRSAEQGGALGGDRATGLVTHFHFDRSARRTGATYSPDHAFLNKIFAEEWNPQGINLLGFIHSHPPGCRRPSGGDLIYARAILQAIPELPHLLLPIVQTKPETGRFEILPFAAVRNGRDVRIEELTLEIVQDSDQQNIAAFEGATGIAPSSVDKGAQS